MDLHVLRWRWVALRHDGVVGVTLDIACCVLFENLRRGAVGEVVVQADARVPHVGNAKVGIRLLLKRVEVGIRLVLKTVQDVR